MLCKGCFAAWAAMVLLFAAGCGLEGPAPSGTKGGGGGPSLTGPASAAASYGNLKQIGLALQNYASTFGSVLPASATVRIKGKPPCSWRVMILPFIEEDRLYKQYHMNEPWDSPHNLEVAKSMPKVYQSPGRPDDGKTCFMMFTGKGALCDGPSSGVPFHTIHDGTSRTIAVVEAGSDKAVPWTKPEDLPFDPVNPQAALGRVPEEGFLAVMIDGSVARLRVDNATLKALITPAGGENVDMARVLGGQ